MTRDETKELLIKLRNLYPAIVADASKEGFIELINSWHWALKSSDAEGIEKAALDHCRSQPKFPPRPADLIQAAGETRAVLDDALYGRYARLRRRLQTEGSLDPKAAADYARVQRLLGVPLTAPAAEENDYVNR